MRKTANGAKVSAAPPEGEEAARWVSIESLVPWKDNPRKNDRTVPKLVAAIKEFGFGAPIIARASTREVIAGHTRLKAAAKLGMKRVPVRFMDLTEKQAHALALADNRIPEDSDWDPAAVATVLRDLKANDVSLAATGFTDAELGRYLAQPSSKLGRDVPEGKKPRNPKTKTGDTWELGPHRLFCGDSLHAATASMLLGGLVDAVVTDPPYAIYGSSTGIAEDITDDAMVRPFFEAAFRLFYDALKFFGHAYVCCDWRSWASLWESAKRANMSARNKIVWDKGGQGLGSNYANTYEEVGFYVKLPAQTAMGDRITGQRTVHKPNLIRMQRVRGAERLHNAAKPVGLFEQFITNSTEKGERVFDPFIGSGTTIIACENTDRVCFAVDKDPGWCDVSIDRWQKLTGKTAKRIKS